MDWFKGEMVPQEDGNWNENVLETFLIVSDITDKILATSK